jgi:hypothetical protein
VSAEAAPPAPPKVDALAALGPLIELAAKGGAGALAVAALVWQGYVGDVATAGRLDKLEESMRAGFGGLSDRIAELERRMTIAEVNRERDEREREPSPAKR